MTHKAAAPSTTKAPRDKNTSPLATFGSDLLSTTWRIAVPVLIFAVGGIFADKAFGTAPWITLGATVAGLGIAGWLLKRQLALLEREGR